MSALDSDGDPEEALQLQFLHGDEFAGYLVQEKSQRGALFQYVIAVAYYEMANEKGLKGAEERVAAMQFDISDVLSIHPGIPSIIVPSLVTEALREYLDTSRLLTEDWQWQQQN